MPDSRIPLVPAEVPSDLKKSYPMKCAACGHEQQAGPSIMMTGFGLNVGHGACGKCGVSLHLEIDAANENMLSERFADYSARMQNEFKHEKGAA